MLSTIAPWTAAQVGYPGAAGLANQHFAFHNAVLTYSGSTLVSSQATGTALYQSTQSQWLGQTITTGSTQTSIGSVSLQFSTVGGSPTLNLIQPVTVSIYADLGGLPTGAPLASVTVSDTYVYTQPFWVSFPLGLTGLTPSTTYHIVTDQVGATGHYYVWQQSNLPGGGAVSPDGSLWSSQSFGLMYQVYAPGTTGNLLSISEDNGSQLTTLTYDALNRVSNIQVTTLGQDGNYITSSGTLAYTNGLVTGVS